MKTLAEVRRKLAAAGKAATIADKDVSQAQANLRHDEKEATTTERELQRAERATGRGRRQEGRAVKDDAEQVLIESPQQWRDWLAEHHATSSGIWLVMWRPASGKPQVTYEQAIEEALCFGWIDGQAQTLDADRTALWLTRRRPGSGWSLLSKQRVARVEADGRMTPVGRARHRRAPRRTARGRGTTTPTTWCCRRTSSTRSRPRRGPRALGVVQRGGPSRDPALDRRREAGRHARRPHRGDRGPGRAGNPGPPAGSSLDASGSERTLLWSTSGVNSTKY